MRSVGSCDIVKDCCSNIGERSNSLSNSKNTVRGRDKFLGKIFPTLREGNVLVVDYLNTYNIVVEFGDGNRGSVRGGDLLNGEVKNYLKPTTHGRGFLGRKPAKKDSRAITKWKSMMSRCYDEKYLETKPTYRGCEVDKDWWDFRNFSSWYSEVEFNGDDWQLDKDLVLKGNKIYCKEFCVLVPRELNILLVNPGNKIHDLPMGVTPRNTGYVAQCQVNGKQISSKTMGDPVDCFLWYKKVKEMHVKERAEFWKGKIDPRVYERLITFKVEG